MMIDVWKGRRWGRWNKERLELGSSFFSMYAMEDRMYRYGRI